MRQAVLVWIAVAVTSAGIACSSEPESANPPVDVTATSAPSGVATPTEISTATPATTRTSVPEPTATPTTLQASPTPLATATTAVETPVATPRPSPSPATKDFEGSASTEVIGPFDLAYMTEMAMSHVQWLAQELGERPSASGKELEAAKYIEGQLQSFGFSTELQSFTAEVPPDVGEFVIIESPEEDAVTARVMAGSGQGEFSGPIVSVGLARGEDLPSEGLEGAIALAERGIISFERKAENVSRAGGGAMVVFNNESGLFRGTLQRRFDLPVVGVSQDDGDRLLQLVEMDAVRARVHVEPEERPSRNVVGVKEGGGQGIVVIGAHYDSVPEVAGANDNASGTGVILALAEALSNLDLPFEVRVIAFGSEEIGLLGSRHYMAALPGEQRERILFMLNFDALASGMLEVGGNLELVAAAGRIATEAGFEVRRGDEPRGASSDHAPFQAFGIPAMFFFGTDFSRIHTPVDIVEHMQPELLGQAGVIALRGLVSEFQAQTSGVRS